MNFWQPLSQVLMVRVIGKRVIASRSIKGVILILKVHLYCKKE